MEVLYSHSEQIHNYRAATEILPVIFKELAVHSILDVGCGTGTWLKVAKDMGVTNILGVDGEYVNRANLKIDETDFLTMDLRKPFSLGRKFDMVLCLEVAEHLPESSAENFIKSLCEHSDLIIFSAAIPCQGGQNHLNEQWPEYWSRFFNHNGFYINDSLRPLLWNNEKIEFWYRQNIFTAVRKNANVPGFFIDSSMPNSYVHPMLYQSKIDELNNCLSNNSGQVPVPGIKSSLRQLLKAVGAKLNR